jgi:AraC-like DNA-binding protein
MFLDLLSLLVGFLCLFIAVFMICNPSKHHKTNVYFIVILFVVGFQRLIYAIEVLGLVEETYSPLKKVLSIGFYFVPIYYLFFRRLIHRNAKLKNELLHFILPTVWILKSILFVDFRIGSVLFLFYSVFYFVFILIMVKNFIYRKRFSMLDKIEYPAVKSWLFLMVSLVFLLIVFTNYFLFSESNSQMNLNSAYRCSSIFWFVILMYMFKNPIMIFGEHYLLKNIRLNESTEFLVWSRKLLKPMEEKDKVVYNTIAKRIDFIISDIQILQKSLPMLTTTTFTTSTLSKELIMPKRHLEFVFKYYCHYSINDFSNLVKVNYAVSLIDGGYLDNYTVASLGEKCLFNSRFTFSKNFKKFIGISVIDYRNSTVKSKLFSARAVV